MGLQGLPFSRHSMGFGGLVVSSQYGVDSVAAKMEDSSSTEAVTPVASSREPWASRKACSTKAAASARASSTSESVPTSSSEQVTEEATMSAPMVTITELEGKSKAIWTTENTQDLKFQTVY